MSVLKIGFVGCGAPAYTHRDRLVNRDGIELVGCQDTHTEQAESFAAALNLPVFKDVVSLYEKARPDAVYITVPPETHGDIELEAVARGIHFYVETPIAPDLQTARAISAAIAKSKVLAMAGYSRRHNDLTHTARQFLGTEVISLATGRSYCPAPASPPSSHRKPANCHLLEEVSHVIDLLLYLCGPVSEVHALSVRGSLSRSDNFDLEESAVINLRLKTGAVASITATCVLNHATGINLEVITPCFSLVLTDTTLRVQETFKATDYLSQTDRRTNEMDAFIHALQQGKPGGIRTSYREAVKTFRICLAVQESIRTGLPVLL
ncbi:MAG TPA: Gfo/Idh/MocA family oxidoreductase [Candidatus Hydrogenedentes bacterium]|mgnify:CR=1 FL=1|nr:Gfo/Idh/MocA family oxidoreductase [Candidatus Hydrogenedentota bacterium]